MVVLVDIMPIRFIVDSIPNGMSWPSSDRVDRKIARP